MICIYVDNKKEKFGDMLLHGSKLIETRTTRSANLLLKAGLKPGMLVGIVYDGMLRGLMTVSNITKYESEEQFAADIPLHRVEPGSQYWYDKKKGKVGIGLIAPTRLYLPQKVERIARGGYTYTII